MYKHKPIFPLLIQIYIPPSGALSNVNRQNIHRTHRAISPEKYTSYPR